MAARQFEVVDGGLRLDRFLAQSLGISRNQARVLIRAGDVRVNGKVLRVMTKPLRTGNRVEVVSETIAVPRVDNHAMPKVLYIDKYILVLSKPPGLLSENDRYRTGSVFSLAPGILRDRGERDQRVWLVHRLDAHTSGVLVLGRTPLATKNLGDAFRRREVQKTYLAVVAGALPEPDVTVDAPIDRVKGTQHGVMASGREAQTRFLRLPGEHPEAQLVEAQPATGRTHQIRVHLAHLGCPILGDGLYGGPRMLGDVAVPRTLLHAAGLRLRHPRSGEPMHFTAPLPDDFQQVCQRLEIPCP